MVRGLGVLLVVLAGCGDDAAGPAPAAKGQVVLPAGFALAPSELTVVSSLASAKVGASGAFEVYMPDREPTEVELLDPDGRLVMVGLMADDAGEVSAATTAQALLYDALGAAALPAEHARTLRALLAGVPELDGLTAAIEGALVASPSALAAGDPTLTAALQVARDAALATSGIPAAGRSPLTDAGTDLRIEPATPQSGVEVLQNPVGTGVVAQNNFRRRAALVVYRVAEDDADGNKRDVTPPVEVGRVDLVTSGKLELFTALTDVIMGTAPFTPTVSAPLPLPLAASGKRAYYTAVVLGPTLDAVTAPPLYADPRFTALHETWDGIVLDKGVAQFFGEIVLPLLESFVFGKTGVIAGGALDGLSVTLRSLSQARLTELTALVQHKAGLSTAIAAILDELASDPSYRTAVLEALIAAAPAGTRVTLAEAQKKLAARASAAAIIAAVQILMASGDMLAIIKDLGSSLTAEAWEITAVPAAVRISPTSAIVDKDHSQVAFTVAVRDLPGPFAYRWSTSGTYGYVYDYTHQGQSVDGTSEAALYQVENPLAIESGHSDTVTVEVFARGDGGGIAPDAVPIGKATAVVTHKKRNLDGRFFLQPGAMQGFRNGPVPCAVMMLRFPKEPGAKSYDITFAGYGGVGDRDYNNNSYLVAESTHTVTVQAEDDPIEEAWDGQCYWSYGVLAGFALSPQPDEYWLATYMAFEPLRGDDGSGSDLLGLGEQIELWYQWLDGATVTVRANH